MSGLCAVKKAFLKPAFILLILGGSIFEGPPSAWANTLGLPFDGRKSLIFPTMQGEIVSATESGVLSIRWLNPSTNKSEIREIRQRMVLGFDQDFIEKIVGRTVNCMVLFDFEDLTFGECRLRVEGRVGGDSDKLYKYLELFSPDLVGCSEFEKRAFRSNNLSECPLLKNDE